MMMGKMLRQFIGFILLYNGQSMITSWGKYFDFGISHVSLSEWSLEFILERRKKAGEMKKSEAKLFEPRMGSCRALSSKSLHPI